MEIRTLYKAILKAINLEVEANDAIVFNALGEKTNAYVTNKLLVFPSHELLRKGVGSDVVAFHPISENIIRGESDVIKKLKGLAVFKITTVISCLIAELTEIAADKDSHAKLAPELTDMLKLLPKADGKTVDAFNKIIDATGVNTNYKLFSIYLKRGGVWKGNKYNRVCKALFPITDEFESDASEIFGVKLRKADKDAFIKLFEYLIPHAGSEEQYSYGSNSTIAPYFHSLMKSFCKVAKELNAVIDKFRKHLDNPDELYMDVSWEESLDDLSIYKDIIPSLNGNEGHVVEGEGKAESGKGVKNSLLSQASKLVGKQEPPVNTTPSTSPGFQNVPPTPQQTPSSSSDGLNWDSLNIAKTYPQMPPGYQQPQMTTRGGFAIQPQQQFGHQQTQQSFYQQPQQQFFQQPQQQYQPPQYGHPQQQIQQPRPLQHIPSPV